MGTNFVGIALPVCPHGRSVTDRIKYLTIQKLISQPGMKALGMPALRRDYQLIWDMYLVELARLNVFSSNRLIDMLHSYEMESRSRLPYERQQT